MSACNCMAEMEAKLAEHNTRLQTSFCFPRDGSPAFMRPLLGTEKIKTRKRVGPALALASFCPFCGTKYERDAA